MCADVNSDISLTDLSCPITLQLFRDPVIAGDGRVYEREAITRWILEHGSSPFTREPLRLNELHTDVHLKRICAQRKDSISSWQWSGGTRTRAPPLRPPRSSAGNQETTASSSTRPTVQNQPRCRSSRIRNLSIGICIALLVAMGIIFGTVFGLKASKRFIR